MIDVDVALGADVVAARIAVFVFIVLGGVEAIGAEASHFAAGAPAVIHEERLAAPGALLLRLTYPTDGKREKKTRFNNRVPGKPIKRIRYAKYQISRANEPSPLLPGVRSLFIVLRHCITTCALRLLLRTCEAFTAATHHYPTQQIPTEKERFKRRLSVKRVL